MKLGAQLKSARQKLGVTQEIVAAELHVSRQTISSWENERSYPDIASLIALSDYYQLSLDELLKEDNGMADDLARKERELKEAQRIWLMSYVVNLLLLLLLLARDFELFSIRWSHTAGLVLVMIIGINVYLLSIARNNYRRLKAPSKLTNKVKWGLLLFCLVLGIVFSTIQRNFLEITLALLFVAIYKFIRACIAR
ncbi:helix-turn-helix domain-containing protein [Loigolactobacillus binensis]|uniref:Helix-turn-helix domain-containing protein n=1 Tax=Loigolactobacillus binensis TaxID=2559922 RepID=A0ABW3EFI0_9LACO|nr:helix-turn-helix transcriptional regulator [Loigolactobacillus binensis]